MVQKTVKFRVKKKWVETTLLLPENMEEAVKMLPAKELMRAIEERCAYLARLGILRDGRPPRQKKKITLEIDKLDPRVKETLMQLGVI